jgi:hypothetical protein
MVQDKSLHKFDRQMNQPLTHRQRFALEYASHFIPFLILLEQDIGHDAVIKYLHKLALQEAEEYAAYVVESKGKNDLTVFKEDYSPTTPGISEILTIEVLKDTDDVYAIEISECIWAEVFREAGVPEFGHAAVCSGDVPFAECVNPKISLNLEGTIMEGKKSCRLRYHYKTDS